jgi:hypothetical protein
MSRGIDRSELIRQAIGRWLNVRDQGSSTRFIYPAAPRLMPEEKTNINPRAVWLKEPLLGRLRQRCTNDQVHQSEFCLQALRHYLEIEGIEIIPTL